MATSHPLRLHLDLVRLTRGIGGLRLAIADGVERLEVLGGVQKLGFPGVDAYARERLGRSGRWVGDARTLARRLAGLPLLREAYLSGRLSTSKVELLARHLVRGDRSDTLGEKEADAIALAASLTVNELRRRLGGHEGDVLDDERRRFVQLTRHVDRLDAVAFEGVIRLMDALGETTRSGAIEGLLAEGLTTLLNRAELAPDLVSRIAGWALGTVGAPGDTAPDVATAEPDTDVGPVVPNDLALEPELRTPHHRPGDPRCRPARPRAARSLGRAHAPRPAPGRAGARSGARRSRLHARTSDHRRLLARGARSAQAATAPPNHIVLRSHGGGDEPSNLVSLCDRCHLSLVHGGHLTVTGFAPDALDWTARAYHAYKIAA